MHVQMENEFQFINRRKKTLALPPDVIFFPSLENLECSISRFSKLKNNEVEYVIAITISLYYGNPESVVFPLG